MNLGQEKPEVELDYKVEASECSSDHDNDHHHTDEEDDECSDGHDSKKYLHKKQMEKLSEEKVKTKIIQGYIKSAMKAGQPPLPILNRIEDNYLPLLNYQLNHSNSRSLAKAVINLVPKVMDKMYLINNSIKDIDLAAIFHGLSQTNGLKGIGVIGNGIGPIAYQRLMKYLIPSKGFKNIKKFVLKDPNPMKIATTALDKMLVTLQDAHCQIRVLTLSRLGFDTRAMLSLCDVLSYQCSIQQLDISANGLGSKQLTLFFKTIFEKNSLRSLNISYNSAKQKGEQEESFDDVLCNFLHYSPKLVHFDMSGLGLDIDVLERICLKGIRKSKSLQAIHMNGLGLRDYE